ncbi:MAG: diguanylate cyclase response regulator [Nitrospinae bacterium CG11_big_fil_rev_8_21_14_0_20_45_15]|nr:MAG: diguanylate cyclase response regulator [Nitrospinae bacterium CG11_big_fil_rev_8_21_14_0_20_45_15]
MNSPLDTLLASHILIVDDTPANVDILKVILSREGYNVSMAPNGEVALNVIPRSMPDLILMDVMMPGLNGFEVCEKLKVDEATKEIPVIFVTAKSETEDIVKAFDVGGVDYITKPYQYREILSRIKTHLQNQTLLKNNLLLVEQLLKVNVELDKASRTDSLTGLSNRRDANEKIGQEMVRSARNEKSFSLVLGDIDHFKKINDTYGHEAGDFVLTKVSRLMVDAVRRQDLVSRWGGEEFLIVLPETELAGGAILAENIRQKIESEKFVYNEQTMNVKMSFGVCSSGSELSMDELIKKADDNLYRAKEAGRNKVVS